MEKIVKLNAIAEEAMQVVVNVPDLDEYKNALTIIFNNVRGSAELYRVTNDSGSCIYVDCKASTADKVKEWLSQFGEASIVGKVMVYSVILPDCDYDAFEEAFVREEK